MQKLVNRKGFTLVELVVVIAVLAILAGVGVVAYNGYIEKAREAADIELLGAVNTAFASACAENGVEGLPEKTFTLGGENVTIGTNGAVHLVDKLLPETGLTDSPSLNSAFDKYYEGNESKEFQVFETLVYDPKTGGFSGQYGNVTILVNNWKMVTTDNGDGSHTYTVTDADGKTHKYTVNDIDIDNFRNSSFGNNMSVTELMSQIDHVTALTAGVLGGGISLSKDFVDLEALGITREKYPDPDDYNKAAANAIVFSVANQLEGCDLGEMIGTWFDQNGVPPLDPNMSIATSCAVPYALVTAYATSEAGKTAKIKVNGVEQTVEDYYKSALNNATDQTAIFNMLQAFGKDEGFKTYYSTNGAADLAAFKSAMTAINSNRESLEESDIYEKGFADDGLDAILEAVFGGGTH